LFPALWPPSLLHPSSHLLLMPRCLRLQALAGPAHQMQLLVAALLQLQCRSHFLQHQRSSTGQVVEWSSWSKPQMTLETRNRQTGWFILLTSGHDMSHQH
jgi:hypothetical protein